MAHSTLPVLAVTLTVLAGISTLNAKDDSFRCGGSLITPGMAVNKIVERCGRPAEVEVVEVPILAKRLNGSTYRVGTQTIEYWTYDRGPNQFPARVTVEEGIARNIDIQY